LTEIASPSVELLADARARARAKQMTFIITLSSVLEMYT
jgi:hypothetical protein